MTDRRAAVAAMLGARSVAVVGASSRPDSFGARMVAEAQRGSARVQLVNPRYDRIGELPCAPSLDALDETPDLVLLGVAGLRGDRTTARRGRGRGDRGGAVRFGARQRAPGADHRDRHRRRDGAVRGGLHGLREQRAAACAPWAIWSRIRFRPAGFHWSRIPDRHSPPCCAPAAVSVSGSRCPPGRNWSPTPPTTSSTRSTIPAPA